VSKESIIKLEEQDLEVPKKFERREKDANNRKTYDEVFDQATLLNISKLISNKVLNTVDYPISTGKEANIFKGTQPDGTPVAIKIYRLATSTFKKFMKYIDGDRRFKNIRHDHRSIIYVWAKKEYKNLQRMTDHGIPVPKPIFLRMVNIPRPAEKFKFIIKQIKKLYSDSELVHGDLSEYNILVNDDGLILIDVGQSVIYDHPMAEELMIHDIENISRYFMRTYGIKINIEKNINEILALRGDE
jgi:RIO kinase 1